MVGSNMDDMTLPVLFEQSQKIHQAASDSAVDQDTVKRGCELLRKCEDMIGKLGLFSANETKEDISTSNLKYLLVPFYLGELTEKISQEDRIHILKTSQEKLKEFITFCEAMELVPEEELERSSQAMARTPSDLRARKIARFKRQKAAELKLLEIKERKVRRGRSARASTLSTPVRAREEDIEDDDGEEEREAWLTTISLAICKAFDLFEMLKKEEERKRRKCSLLLREDSLRYQQHYNEGENELTQSILDERAKKAESWHRDSAARARYAEPAVPITCATFAQDVLEGRAKISEGHEHKHQPMIFGPASLINRNPTSERERIANRVFQPNHRLPTMSIEEAGLKEMEIMNKWQERNAKLIEEATNSVWYKDNNIKSRTGDEGEDEDDDDAAVEKARAWDDWKDDNPRGAGNKKLAPCG